jgi:eukaryotic-like serine/threonine-protein kinase
MELVEGQTLANRIKAGPIPVEESLKLALQVAEALEAAHEKGVIHRDLKPANIKVTPEGKVKVLDFGLAKAFSGEREDMNLSNSPTLSDAATQQGVILGTAAYMAPEQARGSVVDKRCDIWSFGVVLFEMLTGRQLFAGETISDTLAAVLRSDVDWNILPASTPGIIRNLLRRCLIKDRKQRLQAIGEARIVIEEHLANPSGAPISGSVSITARKKLRFAWGIAIICLVAAVALGVVAFIQSRKNPIEAPVMRLDVKTPPAWSEVSFALSPDGRHLVFAAATDEGQGLWLRPLDQTAARLLPGTEDAQYPFWSPDSRSVGFFAGGQLKRINIGGGPPQVVADAPEGVGGTWNKEDTIVFAPAWGETLYRVPASGGREPVAITRLDSPRQASHLFPKFLPDGRHLLFYSWGIDKGIYLGALDSAETRRLAVADTAAAYVPSEYLLFMRQSTLYAQRFNASSGDLTGEAIPVVELVAFYDLVLAGGFSVSETGMLAYRTAVSNRRRLVWFDRAGKEVRALGAPDENYLENPELSPDGRTVAVDLSVQGKNNIVQGNLDICLIDAAGGEPSRLTFDSAQDRYPVWSHDGKRIIFSTNRKGDIVNFYQKASSGEGNDEPLLETSLSKRPTDCSLDSRFLLFTQFDKTGGDICVLPLFGNRKPFPFVNTKYAERSGQFSPDGRWVAYQSNESGKTEVYIQPFPGPGGRKQISNRGGMGPRWRHDGKELFYIAMDFNMMAVPIEASGSTLEKGTPVPLFQTRKVRMFQLGAKPQYAVSLDGQRFLINTIADESFISPITIATNWTRALKK